MIIAVAPSNALGNTLFNHAHLMAAAAECDTRFVNPFLGSYAALFPSTRRDPLCVGLRRGMSPGGAAPLRRALCNGLRKLHKAQTASEHRDRSLPGTRIVRSGWTSTLEAHGGVVLVDREPFRSLAKTTPLLLVEGPLFRFADRVHFVRRWRPLIAEYFRPDREVVQRAAKTASLARRGRTHLFGVHVRRGDYKNFIGGRYFYEWDAYEQLMRGISETWGANQVAFLVCSDEPVPPDFAAGLTWTAGPGDILGDLEALGACDRLLSPPSSFSGWASFVADKPRYEIVELSHVPQPGDFVQSQG